MENNYTIESHTIGSAEHFLLLNNGEPVLTPGEEFIVHKNKALIEIIIKELNAYGEGTLDQLTIYSMFCMMKDYIEAGITSFDNNIESLLLEDPSLTRSIEMEADNPVSFGSRVVSSYLLKNGLDDFSLPMINDYAELKETVKTTGEVPFKKIVEFVSATYSAMTDYQKCVVVHTLNIDDVFLLGIILADKKCDSSEYAYEINTKHNLNQVMLRDLDFKEQKIRYDRYSASGALFEKFIQLNEEISGEAC